jgi:HAMP domain-containing protein
MAEAFEIIGLASSIVAFVDFSIKLVSAVKAARDSVHDTLPEVHEIELCLEDVRHSNLRAIQGSPGRHLSQGEKHIMAMATECERLAGELGEIVQKLKIRDGARFRTIESSRIALRVLRKGKDIEDLRRRIDNLDVRIRANVQLILDRLVTEASRECPSLTEMC